MDLLHLLIILCTYLLDFLDFSRHLMQTVHTFKLHFLLLCNFLVIIMTVFDLFLKFVLINQNRFIVCCVRIGQICRTSCCVYAWVEYFWLLVWFLIVSMSTFMLNNIEIVMKMISLNILDFGFGLTGGEICLTYWNYSFLFAIIERRLRRTNFLKFNFLLIFLAIINKEHRLF